MKRVSLKKLLLVIGLVAIVFPFASCKKECVCKFKDGKSLIIPYKQSEGKKKCADFPQNPDVKCVWV